MLIRTMPVKAAISTRLMINNIEIAMSLNAFYKTLVDLNNSLSFFFARVIF